MAFPSSCINDFFSYNFEFLRQNNLFAIGDSCQSYIVIFYFSMTLKTLLHTFSDTPYMQNIYK